MEVQSLQGTLPDDVPHKVGRTHLSGADHSQVAAARHVDHEDQADHNVAEVVETWVGLHALQDAVQVGAMDLTTSVPVVLAEAPSRGLSLVPSRDLFPCALFLP